MELTYLGTNAILLRKGESTILVDPHFSRPGFIKLLQKIHPDFQAIASSLAKAGIDHLDAVLLTHTHYDHALDAGEVLRQVGGVLYGSRSAVQLARGEGLGEVHFKPVTAGEPIPIGSFRVVFHPSRHIPFPAPISWMMPGRGQIAKPLTPPAWFWRYQCGTDYAIQVDHILILGSAGYAPGALRGIDIHTVVMGVGGLYAKPKSYLHRFYQEIVLLPGARQVYLSHWDNFFRPLAPNDRPHLLARRSIDRIRALGAQHGQTVRLLKYGKTITS
jgi:hypothetical protein